MHHLALNDRYFIEFGNFQKKTYRNAADVRNRVILDLFLIEIDHHELGWPHQIGVN